jgi:hypothetical protein
MIVSTIVVSSDAHPAQKALVVLFAPLAAVFYWYVFLFLLLVRRYMGRFGTVFAHLLIIYFFLFSRFVAQLPPSIYLPLTKVRSRT